MLAGVDVPIGRGHGPEGVEDGLLDQRVLVGVVGETHQVQAESAIFELAERDVFHQRDQPETGYPPEQIPGHENTLVSGRDVCQPGTTVHHPCDQAKQPEATPEPPSAPVVFYMGTLIKERQLDFLIRVLALVRGAIPDAELHFAVDTAFREAGIEIAENAGLTVIVDRCLKIEHARYHGRMHWLGFNSGRISARRQFNDWRLSNGLPPVDIDPKLGEA